MPSLRPRSATAKLSWSRAKQDGDDDDDDDGVNRAGDLKSIAAQRPQSATATRHLPKGRTTLTELDRVLIEAEEEYRRPAPPPAQMSDAEKAQQQRDAWQSKDRAFDAEAEEREREEQRLYEKAKVDKVERENAAAEDAVHDVAVQARLRRLGLAGDGKATARSPVSALRAATGAEDSGDGEISVAEQQQSDTLKLITSFHTGSYEEMERQVGANFGDESLLSPPPLAFAAAKVAKERGPVTDADFEHGLAQAREYVGDQIHGDMFCKLHKLWLTTVETAPTEESKAENARVRAMVVMRFLRYKATWPKDEDDPEMVAMVAYTAGQKKNKARKKGRPASAPAGARPSSVPDKDRSKKHREGKRRRPQSGPARPNLEAVAEDGGAGSKWRSKQRPASGPARVGWSAEADAYVARLGLVPPLGRPPSAQPGDREPVRSDGKQTQKRRPVSAPARLAATVVARWSHHTLGYAFRGWRDAALWLTAARERLRYCVQRILDDLLYRCMDRWRDQAKLQKVGKALLKRTLHTWNNTSLVHAFNSWKDFLKAEANKYGRMLAMWQGDGRRTYFNMWKDAIQVIKDHRPASHGFFQDLGMATWHGIE